MKTSLTFFSKFAFCTLISLSLIFIASCSDDKSENKPTPVLAGVTILAGSTEGDGDKFFSPGGVGVDEDGNVYVAD